jgi:steroid 5-alpha reductase family enzyme
MPRTLTPPKTIRAPTRSPSQRRAAASPARSPAPPPTKSPSKPAGQRYVSYLDRLQKDAHASELDHTNTRPATFVLLSAVQVPVLLAASYLASPLAAAGPLNRFSLMAIGNLGAHWAGFSIALAIGSVKYFDITEDLGYLATILYSYHTIDGAPSPRQSLAYGCAVLWCLRLCGFVGYRVLVRGSDWRFDKLNQAWAYQLFGWTSGGTWCWANGFCLWWVADAPQAAPLGPLDWAGLAIFAFGLSFEFVADIQKYRFNAAHASGANKKWIDTGLWARSRHPNYFGETTLWLGLSLICLSGEPTPRALAVCGFTPVWSFVFLLFTSLMLLEKRSDAKWGKQAAYLEYKARTPVWLPRLG